MTESKKIIELAMKCGGTKPTHFHSERVDYLVFDNDQLQAFAAALTAQPAAQEPVAWRTRYKSEAGMIGNYPWTYTERERAIERLNPAYEFEPLYTHPAPSCEADYEIVDGIKGAQP
jgi:hypothetical protein